jgi:hypothetical protein
MIRIKSVRVVTIETDCFLKNKVDRLFEIRNSPPRLASLCIFHVIKEKLDVTSIPKTLQADVSVAKFWMMETRFHLVEIVREIRKGEPEVSIEITDAFDFHTSGVLSRIRKDLYRIYLTKILRNYEDSVIMCHFGNPHNDLRKEEYWSLMDKKAWH